MGGLVKAVTRAITPRHATDKFESLVPTRSLDTAVTAIDLMGKNGIEDARSVAQVVPLITGKLDQKVTDNIAGKMGAITRKANFLKANKKAILAGVKAHVEASKARVEILGAVAKGAQEVAVLTSEAQAKGFFGQVDAGARVSYAAAQFDGGAFKIS